MMHHDSTHSSTLSCRLINDSSQTDVGPARNRGCEQLYDKQQANMLIASSCETKGRRFQPELWCHLTAGPLQTLTCRATSLPRSLGVTQQCAYGRGGKHWRPLCKFFFFLAEQVNFLQPVKTHRKGFYRPHSFSSNGRVVH